MANNSSCSTTIRPIIKLIRDVMVIYILTKFGADWLIFVDAIVYTNSYVAIFLIQGQITPHALVQLDP